jgi:hypothetical protein
MNKTICLRDIPKSIQIKIGEELDLPMFVSLTKEQLKEIEEDSRDAACTEYNNCIISKFKEIYLLNVIMFDPSGCFSRGSKAFYTLNLNTFRPTKNSRIKTILSDALIQEIKNFINI